MPDNSVEGLILHGRFRLALSRLVEILPPRTKDQIRADPPGKLEVHSKHSLDPSSVAQDRIADRETAEPKARMTSM